MANDDLHKPLKSINQSIAKLREDITRLIGEVRKIPEAINKGVGTIRDAIQENIQAQAELKLMDYVMEVQAVKPQIEAEQEQIETERDELDERVEHIGERYQKKHAELDEKASERIQELGSHIFEIEEDEFETGIENPFTDQVTATWHSLQSHNVEVGAERTDAVRETAGDLVQTITAYVDRQRQLVKSIQNHRLNEERLALSGDDSASLQVPYYVVEYEIDGVTERQVVAPSRLSRDGTKWCQALMEPIDGAEELLAGAEVDAADETERLDEEAIHRSVDSYAESSALGLSYTDALGEAMPEEGVIPVAIDGGGN